MTDVLVRSAPAPTPLSGSVAAGLLLVPAPTTGRFRPCTQTGAATSTGELLGHVTGGGGRADAVVAPAEGAVRGLLVRPGQLVERGQALVWLEREDAR